MLCGRQSGDLNAGLGNRAQLKGNVMAGMPQENQIKKEGLSENCKRTSGKKTERGRTQLEVDYNQEWRDPDNIYTLQVMREEEKGGSTANTKRRIMKQGK